MDTSKETTYVASPLRMLLLGFLGIVMTVASFACAWPLLPNVPPGSLAQAVGWLGTAFFAICTVLIFSRAFGSRRPTLVVNPQGFRFNSLSPDLIPWSKVYSVGEWSLGRQRMMIVGVTDDIWQSPNLSRLARMSRGANQRFGADGLAIQSTGMPVKFDEMIATFAAYWRAFGNPG